eukprot:scaffold31_cov334-Pavlova_lutheri.AAC.31
MGMLTARIGCSWHRVAMAMGSVGPSVRLVGARRGEERHGGGKGNPSNTDSDSGTVQPLFEKGRHCPSSKWGLGGPDPQTRVSSGPWEASLAVTKSTMGNGVIYFPESIARL